MTGELKVDDELLTAFEDQGGDALLSVNIILREQADAGYLLAATKKMSREVRRKTVTSELKALSKSSQSDLLDYLERMERLDKVTDITTLWIVNAVNAQVSKQVVTALSMRDDIEWIGYNKTVFALSALLSNESKARSPMESNPLAGSGGKTVHAASDTAWGVKWIDAPSAWNMGYRGRNVLVAIIDTGIWYQHPDLEKRIWNNYDEIPGDGIDNDNNGYIDDIHGYDFNNNDPDPTENGIGHGTHVSGTVAGDGSGGTLTGVAPEATLMGCKILDDWGYGEEWDAWEGIEYAVDNGAHVIQGSVGWIHNIHYPERATWRDLCNNTLAAGVIMSMAGGNERGWFSSPDDIRTPGDCPSPWRHPDQTLSGGLSAVIAVGATGYYTDDFALFSSKGPTTWEDIGPYYDYPYDPEMGLIKPDICAPGENINSTVVGGGYSGDSWDGTSMATPHNSGLIALMLSKNLAMTPMMIDNILQTTALELGPAGKDNDYGSGRIQADAALLATPELAGVTIMLTPADTVVKQGRDLDVNIGFENTLSTPLTFDFWIVAVTPSGRITEVLPPSSYSLDGYESAVNDIILPILNTAQTGNYWIVGIIGGYPAQFMDIDRFALTITTGTPW